MSNIDAVYKAIKTINAQGKLAEMGDLTNATKLDYEQVEAALRHLDEANRITHKSPTSTGRDDYGRVLTYCKIRAV